MSEYVLTKQIRTEENGVMIEWINKLKHIGHCENILKVAVLFARHRLLWENVKMFGFVHACQGTNCTVYY